MTPIRSLVRCLAVTGAVAAVAPTPGCGGRPDYWNHPVQASGASYGLANGVALVDDAEHRVVIVTATSADLGVATQSVAVGHQVVAVTVSPDASQLFVLSAGDWPRRTVNDQGASLTVIDFPNKGFVAAAHSYPMSEPYGQLAVDPQGQWAVAYGGPQTPGTVASGAAFVQNRNEIVLFDLAHPPATKTRTIQSFGGTPKRIVFTPKLALPTAGQRRLLLLETDIDLTMLDLDHAFDANPPPEITVPLATPTSQQTVTTAGIVVDGRDSTDPNDSRFAIWASNNTNVFTLQLVAPTTDKRNDFAPLITPTDVGGIPTDVAFVRTQDPTTPSGYSLSVAALVPTKSSAVVFQPDVGITTTVALPAPYASLSLVTDQVTSTAAASAGNDVALLWNSTALALGPGIALWSLNDSVTRPYASISTLGATQPVSQAFDVPYHPLKVLQMASGSGFYVLDLSTRTAPPLNAAAQATLSIAPDGDRLWAFEHGGTDLAAIDFTTLNPVPLTTDLPIDAVYDVAASDKGRALIAIHSQGAVGVTVFDALNPVTATSRRVAPILLEGP